MKALISSAAIFTALIVSNGFAYAATGTCHKAKTVVIEKTWEAVNYKYSPQYIADNKAEFEKLINGGAESFFNDCQSKNLSDEQILLQGALDFAAMPLKQIADEFLVKIGLPPLGDKALHIDVKDIDKHGVWGGPNSVFRKPFG